MHTPFVDKSPQRRRDGAGAGSWLKQRLAQILTRSSCSAAANSSDAVFVSVAKAINAEEAPPSPYFCTPCTYERERPDKVDDGRPPQRRRRRRSRSASLVHISVDCTGGGAVVGASGRRSVHSDAPLLLPHQRTASSLPVSGDKKQISRRRRRSKPVMRSPPSTSRRHCPDDAWGRARRPTKSASYSWSSSSSSTATDDDEELVPFSSDGGEEEAETRTLFSSLSFSSDSTSDCIYQQTNHNIIRTRRWNANATRHAPRLASSLLPRPAAPAADAFRPLISVETTKTKKHGFGCNSNDRNAKDEEKGAAAAKKKPVAGAEEAAAAGGAPGMAVVKRSSNPYADFRSSMVEMVVERRIGSVDRMEELLGSYLSLNSPRHHPAILAAFEDVWEAVFGEE